MGQFVTRATDGAAVWVGQGCVVGMRQMKVIFTQSCFFKGNLLRGFGGCRAEHVNQEMTSLGGGVFVFMKTAVPSYSSI